MTDIKKELELTGEDIERVNDSYYLMDMNAMAEGAERPTILTFAKDVAKAQLDKIFNDPRVVVLDDDQDVPVRFLVITRSLQEAYEQAERDMLKAGFKRVRRVE
uniref:Uncharacterized protein n=1 Tax=viral metagenome TaxID=1070528 RepID=A0A6M3LPQ0_9ZZZZ